ncbi:Protein CBG25381 [Caenorhabditis briggsae]|uniref:Protein CBG25381 n=1 Tax=Caenorhabditis briggsae TaxID=6238 RepID=B6IIP5_CAEBR|nr:Protein CBG25381 [Caenorhabditis briggsae]CAR99775.1 Protein CBG25381 [Caenorhabditis briggsae]
MQAMDPSIQKSGQIFLMTCQANQKNMKKPTKEAWIARKWILKRKTFAFVNVETRFRNRTAENVLAELLAQCKISGPAIIVSVDRLPIKGGANNKHMITFKLDDIEDVTKAEQIINKRAWMKKFSVPSLTGFQVAPS